MQGPSPVAASGGHSSSQCAGLSLSRPLPLRSTGSRRAGSVVVAHGPSRSAACGIFLDRGTNPCPLHWQVDSQPLRHQGSPRVHSLYKLCNTKKLELGQIKSLAQGLGARPELRSPLLPPTPSTPPAPLPAPSPTLTNPLISTPSPHPLLNLN